MRQTVLILKIFAVALMISCSNNQVQNSKQQDENELQIDSSSKSHELNKDTVKIISEIPETELAVLIGKKIIFLNDSLKPIKDSIVHNGNIVKLIQSSDSLVYDSYNPCNSYKYFKVDYNNHIRWIDSRNVYTIKNSRDNALKIFDNKRCKLYQASNFHMDWFPKEEWDLLNDCNNYYPLVLEIDSVGYFGPIKLVRNHLVEGEEWLKNYPYFELLGTSDMYDEILSVSKTGNDVYLIKIKRSLQEASYNIDVILKSENDCWTAEYVRFGKWKAYYPKEQKYYDEHVERRL